MKTIKKKLGDVWCLFVHGFILDKHKLYNLNDPMKCDVCGRRWETDV